MLAVGGVRTLRYSLSIFRQVGTGCKNASLSSLSSQIYTNYHKGTYEIKQINIFYHLLKVINMVLGLCGCCILLEIS
jgi:hypothetical protein